MSPEGNKGEIEFAKKHKISRKEDPAGNGDEVFKGSNIKVAKYDKQDAKVYEEAGCNKSGKGVHCEMHGDSDCSGSEPKDMPKKGQKVLLDKKKNVAEGRVEDVTHKQMTKKLSDIAKSSSVPVTKLKPGKKQYNELKSTGQMFGGARKFSASLAKREIEGGEHGSSVGRAKVGGKLKEDTINEVAPPNPKIEAWIKANKERFIKEYGKEKGTQVLYAKAWKMHGQSESGGATNTEYTGGTLGSTGRLDVGTL
jgi:hypothetical protein